MGLGRYCRVQWSRKKMSLALPSKCFMQLHTSAQAEHLCVVQILFGRPERICGTLRSFEKTKFDEPCNKQYEEGYLFGRYWPTLAHFERAHLVRWTIVWRLNRIIHWTHTTSSRVQLLTCAIILSFRRSRQYELLHIADAKRVIAETFSFASVAFVAKNADRARVIVRGGKLEIFFPETGFIGISVYYGLDLKHALFETDRYLLFSRKTRGTKRKFEACTCSNGWRHKHWCEEKKKDSPIRKPQGDTE